MSTPRIAAAVDAGLEYAAAAGYASWDPFDVWSAGPARALARTPRNLPERVARATVLRAARLAPRALRRAGGVPERVEPESLAYAAEAHVRRGRPSEADLLLDALTLSAVPGGHAWGLGYPLQGDVRLGPDIPAVSITLKAFRAFQAAGRADECDAIAERIALLTPLPSNTGICFPYTPTTTLHIHNANLAAAEMLAPSRPDLAREAAAYFAADASFEYLGPEDRRRSQIDHTHAALVIVSLARLGAVSREAADALTALAPRYLEEFFADGWPVGPGDGGWTDGRSAAEALRALQALGEVERARKLADVVLDRLRAGDRFAYRIHRGTRRLDRMPYLRWSHLPLVAALAELTS